MHLGLVLFGLALGVLLVEVGLRTAAFVVGRWYAFESPTSAPARVRVLSLGDSNTFGLYVGKIRAYPHLLEARWNARADRRPIDVVNGGYPGNTTWSIRGQLGDLLAAYRPDVVTVMVGGNDSWRDREPHDDVSVEACVERARTRAGPPRAPGATGWRLVRALRLLEAFLPQPLEHLRSGDPRPPRRHPDPTWPNVLLANLGLIEACVERAGAQVVFLTYPSNAVPYNVANDAMRVHTLASHAPLIDLAQRFAPRCPRWTCDYLFGDQHPTVAGHAWIGEILADALPDAVPSLGAAAAEGPGTSPTSSAATGAAPVAR